MTPQREATRRRSCLAVPADSERKVKKSRNVAADETVLDLEDSVSVARKDAARAAVVELLSQATSWGESALSVRINAVRSPWCHLDVMACGQVGVAGFTLVVPKVESAGDLEFIDRLLDGVIAATGRSVGVRVQALIETADGLDRVSDIAAASPRLESLVLGYADLAASLGRPSPTGPEAGPSPVWLPAQEAVLWAARAHGLLAIDGPWLGIADDAGFRASVEHARGLGYDGKWIIHPAQVPYVNEAFTPSAAEVANAKRVLASLQPGGVEGTTSLDGQMIDEAVVLAARRLLARASPPL